MPPGDLLILADLAYEFRDVGPLLGQIDGFLANGGSVWVLDPGRPTGNDLFAAFPQLGEIELETVHTTWAGAKHEFRMARITPRRG